MWVKLRLISFHENGLQIVTFLCMPLSVNGSARIFKKKIKKRPLQFYASYFSYVQCIYKDVWMCVCVWPMYTIWVSFGHVENPIFVYTLKPFSKGEKQALVDGAGYCKYGQLLNNCFKKNVKKKKNGSLVWTYFCLNHSDVV